jgi:ABC-type multidrug transport system ATPase subunit
MLYSSTSKAERNDRVQLLLNAFGIQDQAKSLIGTPIQKGISGGQKRRVSVASQLITSPKILFMDEPTSGLDSTASYEVISYLKKLARRNNVSLGFVTIIRYLLTSHEPDSSSSSLVSINRQLPRSNYLTSCCCSPKEKPVTLVPLPQSETTLPTSDIPFQ